MRTKGDKIASINQDKLLSDQNLKGILKGIPSSPGIAIGKARIIKPEKIYTQKNLVHTYDIDKELKRFRTTIKEISDEFDDVLEKVRSDENNVRAIIESNNLILKDPILISSIEQKIKNGNGAESAVVQEFDMQKSFFSRSKDGIMRERAIELDHLKKRILLGFRQKQILKDIPENSIIVAQSLTPTDVVNLKEAKIAAIITEVGGIASHASILARSFGIPEVISVKNALNSIRNDSTVIVDAFSGDIFYNPGKTAISNYILKKNKVEEHKKILGALAKKPARTIDGLRIKLRANIDRLDDIHNATLYGAEGAGLVRSESLITLLNKIPDEETQYKWYREIADSAYPSSIALRVFDIGSDKFSEGMPHHEENPALGFRGIRYLLSRKDVFITQLRAILRASSNKNIKIILPMISNTDEVHESRKLLDEAKEQLKEEDVFFDENITVGVMIETPASALISEGLAEVSDFFSIGTNDLTQYTIGADRNNELVSDIYDSFHPSVIKLIKMASDAANKKGIPISICGELAGHSASTELLIGLGIRELSISPPGILELKSRLSKIDSTKCSAIAAKALSCTNYDQVRELLTEQEA